ncbi:3-hydroxyacyl-[acyl-carrier-protein] dehydratase [Anaerosphaera aminiphila DSM 21120]|uniref:3-hydroxyacyl-[acyl-carrier-protein] dehydratase FabZ n=1 Tax=Anaerosphaera aminiphila DSM 21120 TaxID=1120995 RepID=A0A1M5U0Y7_9FIRM|nr:3-hydroxyacyl-ACP dehydratase FabZ [Anaerosphaera aminiphila]SHH56659.1 3-hydroxyacyl-[acyl-carrier-protein] dehydratase [Anaerosphaera aminiphila DSM 21120]
MQYNSNEIMDIIPHRYPFLLVDKIVEIEEGHYAKGIKNISISDAVFQGHFPDNHVYPGVLIVETMAQVGAVAILSTEDNKGKTAYFTSIKSARFLKMVKPGDTLEITSTLKSQKLNIGFASCEAYVEGELVCKAEISFAIGE